MIDLFSKRDDVTVEINDSGEFRGAEGVRKCYVSETIILPTPGRKLPRLNICILMVPISGIVDIDLDGKQPRGDGTAHFTAPFPGEGKLRALIGYGIWEMDYIKEDGVWKIWKLLFCDIFSSPVEDGWVKTPFINNPPAKERPAR